MFFLKKTAECSSSDQAVLSTHSRLRPCKGPLYQSQPASGRWLGHSKHDVRCFAPWGRIPQPRGCQAPEGLRLQLSFVLSTDCPGRPKSCLTSQTTRSTRTRTPPTTRRGLQSTPATELATTKHEDELANEPDHETNINHDKISLSHFAAMSRSSPPRRTSRR